MVQEITTNQTIQLYGTYIRLEAGRMESWIQKETYEHHFENDGCPCDITSA